MYLLYMDTLKFWIEGGIYIHIDIFQANLYNN